LETRPSPDNHNNDDEYAFWLNHGQKADWPIGQPVPLPKWGSSRPPLVVSSIEEYEELTRQFENEVQTLLQAYNYDSITNFIKFYNEFKNGKCETLEFFFRKYKPPLTKNANTCVGLGLLLIGKLALLEKRFPGVKNSLYLVSCEESIESHEGYISNDYPDPWVSDKEHVMVAMQIEINGRGGVILLDPGYQIGRVITVMIDQQYPHTGRFVPSSCPQKEYCYQTMVGEKYVQWSVWNGSTKPETNLVYIGASYHSPVSVTERRNLVYNFRSLLATNSKGHLLAGVYFKAALQSTFTLFCDDDQDPTIKHRIKVPSDKFITLNEVDNEVEKILNTSSKHLKMTKVQFCNILSAVAKILEDKDFLDQMCKINDDIYKLGVDENNNNEGVNNYNLSG
ncbi:uncharacterized protein LOC132926284, partial [Rhopalosiphum padi]|uniref:uncharacterized protein LOC132926284 n=1 Tax=Rhopalosiphum padi TaxID=40932 RepID=UPI00298E267C